MLLNKATGLLVEDSMLQRFFFLFIHLTIICLRRPPFSQELVSSENWDAATISQVAHDHYRLECIVQLSNALAASASDLLKLYERRLDPIVSKLSKGLASLPDELIGLILTFAVHSEEDRPGYVGCLSQISRRFRRIVQGNCTLWSTLLLCYDTKIDYIEQCINRSGADTDIRIIINDSASVQEAAFDAFVRTSSSVASRWRTVTLSGDWERDWETADVDYTLGGTMNQLFRHRLTLPRLQELDLTQYHYFTNDEQLVWIQSEGVEEGTSWITPNLRVLRCTQYIPSPTLPFNTITIFSLALTLVPNGIGAQLEDLLVFLSSMMNLSEVNLGFVSSESAEQIIGMELQVPHVSFHPAITTFRLHLKEFYAPYRAKMILGPFMEALRMPNVKHLSLHLDWVLVSDNLSPLCSLEISGGLPACIRSLMPNPSTHPHLSFEILSVNVSISDVKIMEPSLSEEPDEERFVKLTIPLDGMPEISVLNVTTCGQLSFSSEHDPTNYPISLRELRLRSCHNVDVRGLQDTIQSLEDIGAWDTLERVVIRDCALLDYDEMVDVVGAERLHFVS